MSAKVSVEALSEADRVVQLRIPSKTAGLSAEVQRVVATLDVDGDGVITLPELVHIVQAKESTDASNKNLRAVVMVGALLYFLTLGAFFGLAFGANRLLKDSFSLGGVSTDSTGRTVTLPTTMYVGEAKMQNVLRASAEQLSALSVLSFRLETGELIRFTVDSYVATPDSSDSADSAAGWASVVLRSPSGGVLALNATATTLYLPASGPYPASEYALRNNLLGRRRLQGEEGNEGGEEDSEGGESAEEGEDQWMSVEMRPRPGNRGGRSNGSGGQRGGSGAQEDDDGAENSAEEDSGDGERRRRRRRRLRKMVRAGSSRRRALQAANNDDDAENSGEEAAPNGDEFDADDAPGAPECTDDFCPSLDDRAPCRGGRGHAGRNTFGCAATD
jgi:hypothetical protein